MTAPGEVESLSRALHKPLMLLIALLQGIALLFLYRSEENDNWLSTVPMLSFPLWAIALLLPLMLLLSLNDRNARLTSIYSSAYVGGVAILMIYVGYQASPVDSFPIASLVSTAVITLFIASFKALMYVQQRASRLPPGYSTLFFLSWRNLLVPALAALFTLLAFALLMLWQALFATIGIEFFRYLFMRDWFLFPVLSTTFGVGIIVFRELDPVLDTITRLLQGAISLLLPLLVLVSMGYVATLIAVGTDLLWETGWGTAQMLWLTAITLFFVNAVYQDGRNVPLYSSAINHIISAGILVLIVPCVLSAYGLYLRIEQYGLTVARSYAVIVWLLLSLFVIGYSIKVALYRANWTTELGQINRVMSIVIIALLILVNSPLLDLRKLSLSHQLQLLENENVDVDDFDVTYIRNNLARAGNERLDELMANSDDAALVARIERYRDPHKLREGIQTESIERLTDIPVPPALEEKLNAIGDRAILTSADLNKDGNPEFILLDFQQGALIGSYYYIERDGEWIRSFLRQQFNPAIDRNMQEDMIGSADAIVVPPEFNDVIIGNIRFEPQPLPLDTRLQLDSRMSGVPLARPEP